jgi:hypothetical protein
MRPRVAEEPEEPEEPDQPPSPPSASSPATLVPTVGGRRSVELEYRTTLLSAKEIVDSKTLPELLGRESKDGWSLVQIIEADGRFAVLLSKPKDPEQARRPVGFTFRT